MNLNLYLKELKRSRKTALIWALVLAALLLFIMSFFPIIMESMQQLQMLMATMPQGMMSAMGVDVQAFSSPLGFYATYYGLHIMILFTAFTATFAGTILSKEEREGTADFLLTRPITRIEVVGSKMAAFLTIYLSLFVVLLLVTLLGQTLFLKGVNLFIRPFWLLNFYGLLLTLSFGGLGFLLSLFPKRAASPTGLLVGIVLGTYILSALSRISPDTEWIGWASPFHYADFNVLSPGYGLDWWRILVLLGGAVVFLALTFVIYRRKDIYT